MKSFAIGVHYKLTDEGVDPRTDEYYERIDARMRQVFPDKFEEEIPKQTKKATNVVAPAVRSTNPKKVKLSLTAQAVAKRLGVPLEEYAKQMAALERGNS